MVPREDDVLLGEVSCRLVIRTKRGKRLCGHIIVEALAVYPEAHPPVHSLFLRLSPLAYHVGSVFPPAAVLRSVDVNFSQSRGFDNVAYKAAELLRCRNIGVVERTHDKRLFGTGPFYRRDGRLDVFAYDPGIFAIIRAVARRVDVPQLVRVVPARYLLAVISAVALPHLGDEPAAQLRIVGASYRSPLLLQARERKRRRCSAMDGRSSCSPTETYRSSPPQDMPLYPASRPRSRRARYHRWTGVSANRSPPTSRL